MAHNLSAKDALCNDYRTIAGALLKLEKFSGLQVYFSKENSSPLQYEVAFVHTEVLESYLDDLLDFTISDQSLFILKKQTLRIFNLLALLGLLIATVVGFKMAEHGFSFYAALIAVLMIALPSGAFLHLAPKFLPNRRLFFAKILSQEISRRKGIDEDGRFLTKISKKILKSSALPDFSKVH